MITLLLIQTIRHVSKNNSMKMLNDNIIANTNNKTCK